MQHWLYVPKHAKLQHLLLKLLQLCAKLYALQFVHLSFILHEYCTYVFDGHMRQMYVHTCVTYEVTGINHMTKSAVHI